MARAKPLHESAYLDAVAARRAAYLCETDTFTHGGQLWHQPQFWSTPIPYEYLGENLAQGYDMGDAAASSTNYVAVQAAFMASKPHRANILNKYYQRIGLANQCGITVEEFGGNF